MGSESALPEVARVSNYVRLAEEVEVGASAGAGLTYDIDEAIEALGAGPFQYALLALTGLCWTAESMEMLLLSFIKAPLQCAWDISDVQAAFITTSVGIGMLVGAFTWGILGDVYGRRLTFIISAAFTFFFGILSALSLNYPMMVVSRGLVGIGIGGVPISFSLLMEFLPGSRRGTWGMGLAVFWSLGAVFESCVAMFVIPKLGWRWLIAISSLPLGIVVVLSFWLKESPRWFISKGLESQAEEALGSVSRVNGSSLPPGRLVAIESKQDKDVSEASPIGYKNALELLTPGARSLTLKIWFSWFAAAFVYYGLVMVQPESISKENTGQRCNYAVDECRVFSKQDSCEKNPICSWIAASGTEGVCQPHGIVRQDEEPVEPVSATCHRQLTKSDYMSTLWASVGEVPGVLISFIVINAIGRRPLIGYMLGVTAITFVLLLGCIGRLSETIVFFIGRATSAGAFQGIYLFTNEIYPASIRSSTMGISSSVARVGLIVTPFVAQYLTNIDYSLSMWVYFSAAILAVVAVLLIPIETTKRPLATSMQELVQSLQSSRIQTGESSETPFAKDPAVPWIIRVFRWNARLDGNSI